MKYDCLKDTSELANKTKLYVQIIGDEYKDKIPTYVQDYLNSIDDYKNIIKIENTNTISLFVKNGMIYLPTNAYKILDSMKKVPGYGMCKHKNNDKKDIINNNTFLDYIKHVFVKGLEPIEYFLDILLHETMHLCGADGGSGLKEGFTELKTRQLAKKYNLKTSYCGYPKETRIAYELEMILGRDVCDKLTFMTDEREIYYMINDSVGTTEANLYFTVLKVMDIEFQKYINQKFDGITGPLKKACEYNKIDYSKVKELLEEYYKNREDKLLNKGSI